MRPIRHIAVWSLLTVFAAGGVLGPSLHRVTHAVEKIASMSEGPCHSRAVHAAEGPLWTEQGASLDGPTCDLCATRVLVLPPSLGPDVTPYTVGLSWVGTLFHLTSATVIADTFIRGPPSRA